MKLVLETRNKIVESAFFEIKEKSLSLYINTFERWRLYDWTESTPTTKKYMYLVDSETDSISHDFVELIAENEPDIEILNRLDFLLRDKDQLWILMPHDSVYI